MARFDAFAYMRAVRDDAALSSTQKHVAHVMVTWANNVTGECFPEHGAVAEATGYNVQTVRRTLAALVKCGRLGATRTSRPGGGTLIHYTLRVRATSTEGTSGGGGPSGSESTNGSRPPVVPRAPVDNRASDAQGTSGSEDTSGTYDTEPVVSRASLLGNYKRTTPFKNPLPGYTRGSEATDEGRQELAALEAEARRLDIDAVDGRPDARVLRAINDLAGAQVQAAVDRGDCKSRSGLTGHIRRELTDQHYLDLLPLARQGWTARDLAARIENPAHRPRPRAVEGGAA